MRSVFLLPLLLPLVAGAAMAHPADPSQAALVRMTDPQRRVSLHQSITDQGNTCSVVTAETFEGRDSAGNAYWDARCGGGNSYRVTLPRLGSAQPGILNSGAHLAGPTGGPCFQTAYSSVAGASAGTAGGGPRVLYGRPEVVLEARCVASCAGGALNGISACTSICLQGGDASAPPMNVAGVAEINRLHEVSMRPESTRAADGVSERVQANLGFTSASQRRGQRRMQEAAMRQGVFVR